MAQHMAQHWVGKGVRRPAAGRLQEGAAGNSGFAVPGARRDAQRIAAMPLLRAAEDARSPFSVPPEGHRIPAPICASDTLEMFQMDIGGAGTTEEREPLAECSVALSDARSDASSECDLQVFLDDFLEPNKARRGGNPLMTFEPPRRHGVARNLSGHLPVSRPANVKAYGKLMRSLSGHRPKSSRDGDLERTPSQRAPLQLPFAPTPKQLLQRTDIRRQGWPIKNCDTSFPQVSTSFTRMVKSAPVAVPGRSQKTHTYDDGDDDGAFIPPHEFLCRKEMKDDPSQAAFANPSARRLKGLTSLRLRNIVLTKTGFFDGYTEMWQCPGSASSAIIEPF